jgi:hypothetical protein
MIDLEELLAIYPYPGRSCFACRWLFEVGRHKGPCLQSLSTYGITEGAFGIGFGHIGITEGYRYVGTYRKELGLRKV